MEHLHFPLTDALLLNSPTKQRARNWLSHKTHLRPLQRPTLLCPWRRGTWQSQAHPSRLKVPCHHLTRTSSPAREAGSGGHIGSRHGSVLLNPFLNHRVKTECQGIPLGSTGDSKVTEPIPLSLGLTLQTLVGGPGNPPSSLLGNPPVQPHAGLCTAVKASLSFYCGSPRVERVHHIPALHMVLSLAWGLASQEIFPPPPRCSQSQGSGPFRTSAKDRVEFPEPSGMMLFGVCRRGRPEKKPGWAGVALSSHSLSLCPSFRSQHLPALHTCSSQAHPPPAPWAHWKQKVGVAEVVQPAPAPRPQDHWQAQSVGSCTV